MRIALDAATGTVFEDFANAFYAPLIGATFVPLGGMKDGGADAWDSTVFQDADHPSKFYQSSIEKDHRSKIRRTVKRLREFGRDPHALVHLAPHVVRYSDREESLLTDELDVTVSIRDGSYVIAHINDDSSTRAAFEHYLRSYTDVTGQVI